jgi:hypothetical protein
MYEYLSNKRIIDIKYKKFVLKNIIYVEKKIKMKK